MSRRVPPTSGDVKVSLVVERLEDDECTDDVTTVESRVTLQPIKEREVPQPPPKNMVSTPEQKGSRNL